MADTVVLHKMLHIKEQEKMDAQLQKVQAAEYFEQVATELYNELKTKEKAETAFTQVICRDATVTTIKEQSLYIDRLNKKINLLQEHVLKARNEMENKQIVLIDAHVEMKKIEKLIEFREQEKKDSKQKNDRQMMDEISIRQYQMFKQNR